MKFSMTLVFSFLFLIVLVCYLMLDPARNHQDEGYLPSTNQARVLPLTENDEVTKIQIQNAKGEPTITLEKQDAGWMIAFPVSGVADPMIINGLIVSLKLSNQIRRLEPEKSWEEYGLKQPDLKIGIETKESKNRRYLLLGSKAPIGNNVFAKWDQDQEYFLVSEELKAAFSQSLYSIRQKSVFPGATEIEKIHFRIKNEDYELSHHSQKWLWMEPILLLGEVIQGADAEEMTKRIENLNIKEFLDGEKPGADLTGFTLLSDSIYVKTKAGKEETIVIGKEAKGKDAFYAHKDGVIFMISKSSLEDYFDLIRSKAQAALDKNKQEGKIAA